jgi:DHA1 family tetracycline resistance protein-like MFS transporter
MNALLAKINQRKEFIVIFIIVLTDLIGFGLIIPILPKLAVDFNITGIKLGLLLASYSFAQFFAAPYMGKLSDRHGRRPVLLVSKFGTVIAYIIFAYAKVYWLIVFSRLIDGFTGGNIPAARAYISDITKEHNRHKGMALIGVAYGLGYIIGPVIGGVLFGLTHDKTIPALAGALLCLFSFVLTYFFLKESHRPQEIEENVSINLIDSFKKIIINPACKQILLVQFIFMICLYAFQSTLPIFATQRYGLTPQSISFLMVYIGLVNIIIQLYIVKFGSRDLLKSVKIGLMLTGLSILIITLVPGYWVLFPITFIISTGIGLLNAYYPSLFLRIESDVQEGEKMGVYESVSSTTQIFGPLIAGSLITHYPPLVYFGTALIIIYSVFLINRNQVLTK